MAWDLARSGITTDRKGFVQVDSRFPTNIPGITPSATVIGGAMLATRPKKKVSPAVEIIRANPAHVNYPACPSVVLHASGAPR